MTMTVDDRFKSMLTEEGGQVKYTREDSFAMVRFTKTTPLVQFVPEMRFFVFDIRVYNPEATYTPTTRCPVLSWSRVLSEQRFCTRQLHARWY